MKNFLLSLFVFLLLTDVILPQAVAPVQGEVVINTFDPHYETGGLNSRTEYVIIVNRTDKQIDLQGYELQTLDANGTTLRAGYLWNAPLSVIQPYTFLLLSTFDPVNGISRDINFTGTNLNWGDTGYIVLRKQSPLDQSDYIDIVKHRQSGQTFSGIPINSGIPLDNLNAVDIGNSGAQVSLTRGGVSGNLGSLNYHFNTATDFFQLDEAMTPIQNADSAPLPVELTSFSAIVLKNTVKLSWKTETEVNNYGFDIERSVISNEERNLSWEKIGFVSGNGNSNSPKNYIFNDNNVTEGKYSYRLKQIDNDGKYEYSKTIEVNLNGQGKFELSQNYPNPFNPTTTIRFSIAEAGNAKLTLFNILGQELRTLVNEFKEAGIHTINLNANELNSGLYIYKLESNGLTQTRKMTLVK